MKRYTKMIISVIIAGLTMAMICCSFLCFKVFPALCISITTFVMGFEAISDIWSMKTFTIPIYTACLIICVIKTTEFIDIGFDWKSITWYVFVILFGFSSYAASILINKRIGSGDFDIYFLMFLTVPLWSVVLLISSVLVFLKNNLLRKRKLCLNVDTSEHGTIADVKVPIVPLLFVGYIIAIMFGGVVV